MNIGGGGGGARVHVGDCSGHHYIRWHQPPATKGHTFIVLFFVCFAFTYILEFENQVCWSVDKPIMKMEL